MIPDPRKSIVLLEGSYISTHLFFWSGLLLRAVLRWRWVLNILRILKRALWYKYTHVSRTNKINTFPLMWMCKFLKCHRQWVKHDPAEIGAQCCGKQRSRLLHYSAPILLCFLRHCAPISTRSCLTLWWWHFKVPKHVGECWVPIHWMINTFVGFSCTLRKCMVRNAKFTLMFQFNCIIFNIFRASWGWTLGCSKHIKDTLI
jgi:hypothetical protein